MPIYDYQCKSCGQIQVDVFAPMDASTRPCSCGELAERLISPAKGFVFKAGWYEHIAERPIYCGSKADLRCVTRDNNCTSDYAE